MLGYEKQVENPSGCATIGVTEVYRLVEEIEKRKLTSGSIVIYNGKNTGIGCGTFVQFPGEDEIVEITDYGMW